MASSLTLHHTFPSRSCRVLWLIKVFCYYPHPVPVKLIMLFVLKWLTFLGMISRWQIP